MEQGSGFFVFWYVWGDISAGLRPVTDRLFIGVMSHFVPVESTEVGGERWHGCTVEHERVGKDSALKISQSLFGFTRAAWVDNLLSYDGEEGLVRWERPEISIAETALLTTIRSFGREEVILVASSSRPDEQKFEVDVATVLSLHARASDPKFGELVEADGHCDAYARIRRGLSEGLG